MLDTEELNTLATQGQSWNVSKSASFGSVEGDLQHIDQVTFILSASYQPLWKHNMKHDDYLNETKIKCKVIHI